MARDPPSLLAGSELRDLSFKPTAIHNAPVTIVHPQLRDLILPLHRGRVLYPLGTNINEMLWTVDEAGNDDDDGLEGDEAIPIDVGVAAGKATVPEIRPFAKLTFAPNCLTTSRGVLAAGGQHGELYICNLPSPSPSSRFSPTREPAYRPLRPFHISQTLPTRSINNSILILPTWGTEWQALAERRRLGYIGRGNRRWAEQEGEGEGEGWAEGGVWKRRGWYDDDDDLEKVRWERCRRRGGTLEWDSDAMDLDEDDEDDEEGEPSRLEEEDDLEEEEDDDMDELESTSPRSPATYPNTVPFFHPPRIPNLPPSPINITVPSGTSHRRASAAGYDRPRTLSFGHRQRTGPVRQSFSSFTSMPADVGGLQIVSSLPEYQTQHQRSGSSSNAQALAGAAGNLGRRASIHKNHRPSLSGYDARIRPHSATLAARRRGIDAIPVEPRILISNNDQTVKVFSLRATPDPNGAEADPTTRLDDTLTPAQRRQRDLATMDRVLNSISRQVLPPVPAFYGGRLGRDSMAAANATGRLREAANGPASTRAYAPPASTSPTASPPSRANRTRTNLGMGMGMNLDLNNVPMRDSDIRTAIEEEKEEERKLSRVGGARFKTAINHSSISPDLSMMVSVGDSTDVYLFQVLQGGQEFRKIRTLKATDSGFSTAWSKDGRKFAVASQDGQVTVWDHRSTHPLAIFHTSPEAASLSHSYPTSPHSPSYGPSFSADLARARIGVGSGIPVGDDGMGMVLVDSGPGETRPGSSNSGREAARVVKFSPEGSGRDLMVFSEEHSHIHIIDAKTFNSHVVVPVPSNPTAVSPLSGGSASVTSSSSARSNSLRYPTSSATPGNAHARRDTCGQSWGVAGVAFDPTGDWLYSGTESTVVEWDLRRFGGGEGGTWGMA